MASSSAPRVRLVVQAHGADLRSIECHRVVTLLGTRRGCKLTLNHPSVSPVHLALVNNGEQVYAIDLVTQNGSRLNGLKLEHERVNDGDMLEVPPWHFRIDIGPSSENSDGQEVFELEPSPRVVALEHVATGRILQANREHCVIGRQPGCDIHLDDDRVSRAHALLFKYRGFPVLCDLLSKFGTLVNGVPLQFAVLKNGDLLSMGNTQFKVRFVGSAISEGAAPKNGVRLVTEQPFENGNGNGHGPDLIDIAAVDSAARWDIADAVRVRAG